MNDIDPKIARMKKGLTFLATALSGLICLLLLVLMIVLSGIYMIRSQQNRIYAGDVLPEEILYELKSGGSLNSTQFDIGYVLPEFIGFKLGAKGGFTGVSASAYTVRAFYSIMSRQLTCVLGTSYECVRTDRVTGDAMWDACVSGDNYVYIRYAADLPDYLIRCFFGGDYLENMSGGEIAIIRELFILYAGDDENGYSLHAVAKSSDGTVYSYDYIEGSEEERQYFSLGDIITYYRNTNFNPCDFAKNSSIAAASELPLSSTTIIYEYTQSSSLISVSEGGLRSSSSSENKLLLLYNYNPDKLNSYNEAGGTSVYVENHGNLRYSDSMIEYSASENGGVDLSEFIGYVSYGEYNVYETMLAVCSAANRLNDIFNGAFGGGAQLLINSVSYSGGLLNVNFVYAYDNIVIYKNGGAYTAMSFTVDGDSVIEMKAYALRVTGSYVKQADYPQLWMVSRIAEAVDSSADGGLKRVYDIGDIAAGESENEVSSGWVYTAAENAIIYKDADGGGATEAEE